VFGAIALAAALMSTPQATGVSAPAATNAFVESHPEWLQISGFGDFVSSTESVDGSFGIGQVEIGLESSLGGPAAATMAIAYDQDSVVLATFVMGIEANRSTWLGIGRWGMSLGRFDVPFGVDYHCYASTDRRLVTTPAIVSQTHGCWNDLGVTAYVEAAWWNATVFATNGELAESTDHSVGGRLGGVIAPGMEVGASFAMIAQETQGKKMAGADLRGRYGLLALKGEYIVRSRRGTNASVRGFYLGAQLDFGRVYLAERYGDVVNGIEDSRTRRMSSGIGYLITESCEARVEHQARRGERDALYAQLVVSF
jgi:hypothetical protein